MTPLCSTPWTIDAVAERFHEAAITAHRLPPAHLAGLARRWPDIAREAWEGYADERVVLRFAASPAAIDRFVETTRWLRWLDEDQRHLVWARARQRSWKTICARLHCSRITAWRHWQHALALIVVHLNETLPMIVESSAPSQRSAP